ncbi:MAG: hypothetical protein HAW58_02930 [Candidatus Thioglobus sp.]|nr:hypothetical protein [Candidatus Thioglobus sp.]
MAYQIINFSNFDKSIVTLRKRYKNIGKDIAQLNHELSNNPYLGEKFFEYCYKIRLKNSSTNKGKSGGFRVIYYFIGENNYIYLIDIYSKSDQESIKKSHLIKILKNENSD